MEFLLILLTVFVAVNTQSNPDTCPPVDPNCHPWCIEYDTGHCRHCRCKSGGGIGGSSSTSNVFTPGGNSWESTDNTGLGNEWSGNTDVSSWSNNKKDNNGDNVKYVVIEEKVGSTSEMISPFAMPHGPNPFQGRGGAVSPFHAISGAGGSLPMSMPRPSSFHIPYGHTIKKVPISRPGIPIYCVKDDIICPSYCKRMDDQGCLSCPCAPATMTYVKVIVPTSSARPTERTQYCLSTMSCMISCKDGYKLGETGPDGCQTCTCISKAPTTTPATKDKSSCLSVVLCVLSCKDKDGYELGNTGSDGCPTCRCLKSGDKDKGNSGNTGSQNSTTSKNGNNNSNNNNMWNTGSGSNNNVGTSTGNSVSNNILNSQTNGVGKGNSGSSGNCYPMCQGGSLGGMTMTGTGSSSSMGSSQSVSGGSMMNNGGSGSGGSCTGPFCGGGSGMGMGGGGMTMGGSGGNEPGGSGNCAGPFCAMMGGSGGTGGSSSSSGGAGPGGQMVSPFMAAMGGGSGGGGGGGGPSGAGMKSPFSALMGGPRGPLNPMSAPNLKDVKETAYNEKCFGPSCSAKDGSSGAGGADDSCIALVECVLACEDGYELGAVGTDGCQTCTCKP